MCRSQDKEIPCQLKVPVVQEAVKGEPGGLQPQVRKYRYLNPHVSEPSLKEQSHLLEMRHLLQLIEADQIRVHRARIYIYRVSISVLFSTVPLV